MKYGLYLKKQSFRYSKTRKLFSYSNSFSTEVLFYSSHRNIYDFFADWKLQINFFSIQQKLHLKNCVRFFVMENEGSTLTKRGERTSTLLIKGNSSLTSSNHFTCSESGEGEGLFCLIKPKPQLPIRRFQGKQKHQGIKNIRATMYLLATGFF